MAADPERGRVLIVDDEPEIREVLKAALEEMGYACAAAPDADTALQVISEQGFDLVLLDVVMPGRPGTDLFRRLLATHPDLAVVFITARADLDLAVSTMRQGAYDYLVKPVSLGRLEQVVGLTLEKRRALLEQMAYQRALERSTVEQSQLLESYSRQLNALNSLVQDQVMGQMEVEDAAGKLVKVAHSTAELLLRMADEVTAQFGSRLRGLG